MEIFRKIADKARDAKTQFIGDRLSAKEDALFQTELRLNDLNAELENREKAIATKEKALQDEELRLGRMSRRPIYVLLACIWAFGVLSVIILSHYELVARKPEALNPSTSGVQPPHEAAPIGATEAQERLSVPSDSGAHFYILDRSGSGAERTITTKRVGSSGTTYSKRLFNCTDRTVKYIGSGDSLAAMAASKSDLNMGPIVDSSIAYYVGIEACK